MKIAVILRVYNRITDLAVCLDIIRRYWVRHKYHVIVVSNGGRDGFVVPESCRSLADTTLNLETNAGHRQGNSQLIMEGLKIVPEDCEFTVLLEADTWIFSDELIIKYVGKMEREDAVWASAEWIEKYHSLALDFAIIRTGFPKANPKIFDFTIHAESYVCNFIRVLGHKYLFITECMPVHLPKMMRCCRNIYGGRMRGFTRAKMVTHHIEDLAGGLEEKKAFANIVLGYKEFDVETHGKIRGRRRRFRIFEFLVKIMPRSRWIRGKKTRRIG